jgi:hypothetical protein
MKEVDSRRRRRSMAGALAAACLLGVAACSSTQPSGSPVPPQVEGLPDPVLGCLSIEQHECDVVAARVRAELPPEGDAPFTIQVQLHECPNGAPCPHTLAARQGWATIDYADGREPTIFAVAGTPNAPTFKNLRMRWAGVAEPRSPRVAGAGPFPFEIGHCGLTWQVDFDGSFWVPVGQVDGDAWPIINNDTGQMRLLGPNLAEYRSESRFVARLARFPGPKHFLGCD